MLQTEEVDDDYFTPISNTPLASIFKDKNSEDLEAENSSLKYIAPKPDAVNLNSDEPKASAQCIFASAFLAYEWSNNNRSAKGKLGLAIIKDRKMQSYSVILYDANKKPLSSTTICSTLDVILDGTYLSFYDDQRKYWSLYGTKAEVERYLTVLRDLNVNIKQNECRVQETTNTCKQEKQILIPSNDPHDKEESDTDFSSNEKTKAAILNRMASMGQSVLPTNIKPLETKCDSSDTDDFDSLNITMKPKLMKTHLNKKGSHDRVSSSSSTEKPDSSTVIARVYPKSSNDSYQYQGQISPLAPQACVDNVIGDSKGLNIFMSEQRISNAELRININRISDKMEDILDQIKLIPNSHNNVGFQIEIYQKLINEYESKIRNYEEIIKTSKSSEALYHTREDTSDINSLEKSISELTRLNTEKDIKISKLEDELLALSEQKQSLSKDTTENYSLCNNVKDIMNNAYQNISCEFKDDENYGGKVVKDKVGSVIRKVTIDFLGKLEL